MVKTGKCTLKVPNGKMLKVSVEFEGDRIEKVVIKGDFFIHPEESLDNLEMALTSIQYKRKDVGDAVARFFAKKGLIAFGITPKAVTDAVMQCKEAA